MPVPAITLGSIDAQVAVATETTTEIGRSAITTGSGAEALAAAAAGDGDAPRVTLGTSVWPVISPGASASALTSIATMIAGAIAADRAATWMIATFPSIWIAGGRSSAMHDGTSASIETFVELVTVGSIASH